GRPITVVVQSGLADRDHARVVGEPDDRVELGAGERGALVRVDADGGPNVGVAFGERDDVPAAWDVNRDRDEGDDAGRAGTVEDQVEIAGESVVRQMAMGVDELERGGRVEGSQSGYTAGGIEPQRSRRSQRRRGSKSNLALSFITLGNLS